MSDKQLKQMELRWDNFRSVFNQVVEAYNYHPAAHQLRPAIPTHGTVDWGNFGVILEGSDVPGVEIEMQGVKTNEDLEERIHQAIRSLLGL